MFLFSKVYDRWTWERISRHIIYWCAWWVFYATVNANTYWDRDFWGWMFVELWVLPVKLTLTYYVVYVLLPKYSKKKQYVSLFLITVFLAFLGAIIIRSMGYFSFMEGFIPTGKYFSKMGGSSFFTLKMVYIVLDLLFVVSLVITIKFVQQQIVYERKTKSLMTQMLETELLFLKHQLQPHFLFNTLNNLYGLILTKENDRAGDMVVKLSDIMSYMLYESNETQVSVEKELANLENYIALEKIRYGEELHIEYAVSGDTQKKKIPPLILISFVENSFKHGLSGAVEHSWIKINAKVNEGQFLFTVENSLPEAGTITDQEKSRVKSGIGLENVRKRLDLIYGEGYDLAITHKDTYLIELVIH